MVEGVLGGLVPSKAPSLIAETHALIKETPRGCIASVCEDMVRRWVLTSFQIYLMLQL